MKKKVFDESSYKFFPYELIIQVTEGNQEAMIAAINHFSSYSRSVLNRLLKSCDIEICEQEKEDILHEVMVSFYIALSKYKIMKQ